MACKLLAFFGPRAHLENTWKYKYLSALASPADEGQALQGEKIEADMTFGLVWRCMPQNPVV